VIAFASEQASEAPAAVVELGAGAAAARADIEWLAAAMPPTIERAKIRETHRRRSRTVDTPASPANAVCLPTGDLLPSKAPILDEKLLSRKLRVMADWTVTRFFPCDIAELVTLDHSRRLDAP
jgi:hypothetical protein